ncbi:MAG: CpsB/CapC family capsule biosynthesis tyrosine phosphatase [Gemmatimonadaceae bacterium]
MVDIHSHLLPGVDDGSKSIEMSVPVLERFAADGVECLVLTPHLKASEAASAPYERNQELLEQLRSVAPRQLELRLGWEIMLDEPNIDLRGARLGLGGSRAVLVEFSHRRVPMKAADELYRLRSSGVTPVLAHPERYYGCTVESVESWRNAGAVIQMDTGGLLGKGAISKLSRTLVEEGLVDLFSSDNHGDSRTLATARDWLREVATPDHADLMTRTNARRLLDGLPLLPVPPMQLGGGIFGRLRELFLSRL